MIDPPAHPLSTRYFQYAYRQVVTPHSGRGIGEVPRLEKNTGTHLPLEDWVILHHAPVRLPEVYTVSLAGHLQIWDLLYDEIRDLPCIPDIDKPVRVEIGIRKYPLWEKCSLFGIRNSFYLFFAFHGSHCIFHRDRL